MDNAFCVAGCRIARKRESKAETNDLRDTCTLYAELYMDTLSVELSQSIFLSKYLSSAVVVKEKVSTSGADVSLFLGQRDFIYRRVFYK